MTLDYFVFKRMIPVIFSRPAMQPLNRLLFRIAVSGMGINNYDGTSRDERLFLRQLAKKLPAETVILDVGANQGQYAALARAAFPSAAIHSFEPNPAAFDRLRKTAERLKVHAVPKGCADRSGTLTLYDSSTEAGSGLASFVPGIFEFTGIAPARIEATVTTVSEYCAEQGIQRVGLLKIDVEGLELDVLRGAAGMLDRIDTVQFEFNEMNLFSHSNMADIERLLDGFDLFRVLYDGSLLPLADAPLYRKNIFCYQNIVACRRGAQLSRD